MVSAAISCQPMVVTLTPSRKAASRPRTRPERPGGPGSRGDLTPQPPLRRGEGEPASGGSAGDQPGALQPVGQLPCGQLMAGRCPVLVVGEVERRRSTPLRLLAERW